MNRKLHNTISALMFSGAVLVLGLMAANPGGRPNPRSAPQPQAIALDAAAQHRGLIAAPVANTARAEALALHIEKRAARIETLADAAAFTAELATAAALAETLEQASTAEPAAAETAPRTTGKPSRIRQSMAMPYFSFVSRG